ncbi:MAG TPA: FG-GAP-like repeat-containing protein, partial [Opitutaceae bacterium]
GRIDLLVADMAATTHAKDMRAMVGSRARTRDPQHGDTPAPAYPWNAVYLNTGSPRVLEAARMLGLDATDWTWSPRFEDLDNDGWLDLHITNGMHREIHNLDLIGRMMAAESAVERIRIAQRSPILAEPNLAYRNTGDLRFESVGVKWGLDQTGVSFGSAFGDLDGDGDLDLVFTNYQRGATVLRNDSSTGNRLLVDLRGSVSNHYGVGATVRIETAAGIQVRQLVLARGYLSTSEPVLHFGLGDVDSVRTMTVDWPSGHRQVFENLPAGRRYTITEPARPPPAPELARPAPTMLSEAAEVSGVLVRSREEIVDEIAQQRMLPFRLNRRGPALAVGDINADGIDDVAVGGMTLDPLRLFAGGSEGRFAEPGNGIPGTTGVVNGGPVMIFDADGDGRADILATRGGNIYPPGSPELQPALFINKGTSLEPAPAGTLPPITVSIGAAAAADIDGDGTLDIFLGGRVQTTDYPQTPRSFVLVNRGGRFEDVTASVAPALRNIGMVTSALWSDVNGDSQPDLVLALEWGNIRVFVNNGGKLADATEELGFASAGTGLWNSLATADFNGDGRPDFVAGNTGLNTSYTAPATLFAGDFRGDGATVLLEARTIDGRLLPVRSRREFIAAIPALARRIPTNDLFATLALDEIVGAAKLAGAQRFDATELRNGVLLSGGDGRYRWEPLPRIAQLAPFQGVVSGDFNGDGHADVLAVQNSYAPSPVTGRFDGGLGILLLGDPAGRDGGFTPVEPARSGLLVPGDAKALVVLDSDGDSSPDFLVSRNNSTTLLFRNRATAGHAWLKVSLTGARGNATAIGARVTATHADGAKQTVEVVSGSGWMSQSTSAVFLGTPASNPIRSISIRWPGGVITRHETPKSGEFKVTQP